MEDARSVRGLSDPIAAKHPPEQWEWVIATLAERQHGVLATRQLLAAGLTRQAIKRRVRRGRLVRLHRGVYSVLGGAADSAPSLGRRRAQRRAGGAA